MRLLRLIFTIAYLSLLFEYNQSQPLLEGAPEILNDGVRTITGFMQGLLQLKSNVLGMLLGKREKGMLSFFHSSPM